jgi:hypothetical protein
MWAAISGDPQGGTALLGSGWVIDWPDRAFEFASRIASMVGWAPWRRLQHILPHLRTPSLSE